MADKLMYMTIHRITCPVDYNYWLKLLNTHLNKSLKVSEVVKPTNKKNVIQNFGD